MPSCFRLAKFLKVCGLASIVLLSEAGRCAPSLTLYVIPPSGRLNWDSPRAITSSTIGSQLASSFHPIGHVVARVECTYGSKKVKFWTGMTESSDNPSDLSLLVKQEMGMGVMFRAFNGQLEDEARIATHLQQASNQVGRLFSIKFLIGPQHCQRIDQYFREFVGYGVGKTYGLVQRPRYREGAGCTAHAMALLDVAGLLSPSLKAAWSHTLLVPETLIGDGHRSVPFWDLFTSTASRRWAIGREASRKIFFYDTQLFADWAHALIKRGLPADTRNDDEEARQWNKKVRIFLPPGASPGGRLVFGSNEFFGLVLDRRSAPAARGPLWLR